MGNNYGYKDSMERVIELAISIYNNPNVSTAMRKRAGQIILNINDYLENTYPAYARKVRPHKLLKYLTDEERLKLLTIARQDRERFYRLMIEITKPRINNNDYELDSDIEVIIPYISNFIYQDKSVGARTKY